MKDEDAFSPVSAAALVSLDTTPLFRMMRLWSTMALWLFGNGESACVQERHRKAVEAFRQGNYNALRPIGPLRP